MQLDFSQFHPLDHWPGSAYCRGLYGGTRNHLSMTWSYRRKDQLLAATLCKIGRHRWRNVWEGRPGERRPWKDRPADFEACRSCGQRR
ncbi:MAG TPA: hypothetical protein VH084_28565 [Mycobacterium sp.]|jgi:hypothetical protein|nr:hypothetical protein [Mycobacterium sp.]